MVHGLFEVIKSLRVDFTFEFFKVFLTVWLGNKTDYNPTTSSCSNSDKK
jgi:hypothetical protein